MGFYPSTSEFAKFNWSVTKQKKISSAMSFAAHDLSFLTWQIIENININKLVSFPGGMFIVAGAIKMNMHIYFKQFQVNWNSQ